MAQQHDRHSASQPAPTRTAPGGDSGGGPALAVGQRVGSYAILEVLGRGGMGAVYLAEQDKPRRTVALKVVRPGVTTPQLLQRFAHEAEILGRLTHPGIAQIYEAGTADVGGGPQPYFAMELVKGVPLTQYAQGRELSSRARLELLAKVCDAVQHAHQKGVIHRDLKPGNILVTEEGQPKILDFGVARATESDIQVTTLQTDIGQLIGTIPYMSPEQAAGDPRELDTRSDVYALGVMAYELLAGRLPYDLRAKMILEAVRVIREDTPTPLSSVNRTFRGDVETIIGKALEKDRSRRYQSASDLAADIRRHLADEPIVARPPSAMYQFGKFAKRNKVLVSGMAAVFVALVLGVIGTSIGMARAEDARGREFLQRALAEESERKAKEQEALALKRADETKQVAEFQAQMLSGIDAEEMGRTILHELRKQVQVRLEDTWVEGDDGKMRKRTAEEIAEALARFDTAARPANPTDVARQMMNVSVLAPAAEAIEKEFADQPKVQAQLLDTLGMVDRSLGQYDLAEPHLRLALDIRRKLHGEEHPDVAMSLNNLASLLQDKGDYGAAEPLLREALAMRRKLLGDEHPHVANALNNLALLLWNAGDYAACEPLYREALALRRKLLGDQHPDVASSLSNLATLLEAKGDHAGAEPLYREALALRRKLLGDEHLDVANSLNNLAALLHDEGNYAGAEPLYREALGLHRKLLGDEHPSVACSLNNLAVLLQDQGDYAAAEPLFRESLALCRKLLGDDHPNAANSLSSLASLLHAKGDYAAAERLLRQALALHREVLGDEHPDVASSLNNLAAVLQAKGEYGAAEPLLRQSLALRRKLLGDEHPGVASSLSNLAAVLHAKGDYDGAEPLLREALALYRKLWGDNHPDVADSLNNLAAVLQAKGDYVAAEPLYGEALALRRKLLGPDHPLVGASLNNLAMLLQTKGDYAAAEPLLREALALRRKLLGDEHPTVAQSLSNLAMSLEARGDPVAAQSLYQEALLIYEKGLPPGHPRTANAQAGLGKTLTQLGRFAEAEPLLLAAWDALAAHAHPPPGFVKGTLDATVALYDAWHAAEPGAGHDAQAAQWRAKLEQWQATTQPAASQPLTTQPDEPQPEHKPVGAVGVRS